MKKAAASPGSGTATAAYSAVIRRRTGRVVRYLNVYCAETNTARCGAGSAENVGKPVNTP